MENVDGKATVTRSVQFARGLKAAELLLLLVIINVLKYSKLHFTTPHHTTLHYTTLHKTAIQYIMLCQAMDIIFFFQSALIVSSQLRPGFHHCLIGQKGGLTWQTHVMHLYNMHVFPGEQICSVTSQISVARMVYNCKFTIL
jgi:hypothetical protein